MRRVLSFCVVISIAISLVFSVNWKSVYVGSILLFIPKKEKGYLKSFFFHLNVFSDFPFVLNSTKPLTTLYLKNHDMLYQNIGYNSYNNFEDFFECFHPINLKMNRGLEAWKKYAHFFPSNNIYISITKTELPESCIILIIFNEQILRKTINEHYNDFSKILGEHFSCEIFIEKLKNPSTDFHKLVQKNDYLMGLIYGFGKDNAQAFQLRVDSNEFSIPPYLKRFDYPNSPDGLNSSELKSFWGRENPINLFDPFFTSIPNFVTNPKSLQTKNLKNEYLISYKEINKSQREKDILSWSLIKLIK